MSEHESAIISVTRRIIEIMEEMLHTSRLGRFRALEIRLRDQMRLQADILDDLDRNELEEYETWLRDNLPLFSRMTNFWGALNYDHDLEEETIREYEGFVNFWRAAIAGRIRGD